MAVLIDLLRREVIDLAAMVRSPRPLSPHMLAERIDDLADTIDGVESGIIVALDNDPNYDCCPWHLDDLVILTKEYPS